MSRILAGLILALSVGAIARATGLPLPAPPVLVGALLVLAMTLGYEAVDRLAQRRSAAHSANCGGHDGAARGTMPPRVKKDAAP